MSARARGAVAGSLTVLAALALTAAIAVAYVRHVAVDESQFADRAAVALRAPAVRSLVAQRVTDELVLRRAPNLLAARPLIESVVSTAVGGRAFGQLFRAAARDVHRAVFQRRQNTVTLTVADAGTVAASALDVLRPSLARSLRADRRVSLLRADLGSASAAALRFTRRALLTELLLAAIALAAGAGALLAATDRRRAVTALGVAVSTCGILLAVGLGVGRTLVAHAVDGAQARDAAQAVWDAFLGDLRTAGWVLAAIGAVIAAASASLLRPVAIDMPLRAAGAWLVRDPGRPWPRALRALVLIAVGIACVADRGAVIALAFTVAGAYLVYSGVGTLLALVDEPGAATEPPRERIPGRRLAAAVVLAAVLSAAAVGGLLSTGALSVAGPRPAPCDGSRALCDRPLTDVTLAATHNAMSVPLPGWYSAEQNASIPRQLQAGVRGLLIDTHSADRLPDGRLRTDFNGELSKLGGDQVSGQARQAALRLRARLGFAGKGTRGLYLCHTFCELGGTPLATALAQIHDFLVANPQQVLVIVNEDYVAPAPFVAAVRRSGLEAMAYRGPVGSPGGAAGRWPTLRAMIDSGQRVLFLAEHHAGAAPWYHLAYRSILEETPYEFKSTAALTDPSRLAASCAANRGPRSGAPLLLVNSWVSTDPVPLRSNAATVNARAALLRRVRTCERIRHHAANLVAVNFYADGDVFGAVAALNRDRAPAPGGR